MTAFDSLRSSIVAISMALLASAAHAQTYPSRPIQLVVPFPAGGGIDVVARILQPKLAEYLGQPVVIDNKAGASGVIGSAHVARAPADGYTLMLTYEVVAINPFLYKAAPEPNAFDHISVLVNAPQVLVSSNNFKPRSVEELMVAARAKPGVVSFGSPGAGSTSHLGMLMLARQGQTQFLHVPYKGGSPLMQAMQGGEVDLGFTLPSNALASIQGGRLKAIAVGSRHRLPQLPDVPLISDALPGFSLSTWYVLSGPKGMPPDVLARLNREVRRVLDLPEIRSKLEQAGFQVEGSGAAEANVFVKSESEKLGKIIRDFDVKVE